MSVVSMIAVARRCGDNKGLYQMGLCWLEFRCSSLLLGEDPGWTRGVTLAWLSGCALIMLRILDGLFAAVSWGEPEASFLLGFQRVWGRSDPQQGRAGLQQHTIGAKGAQQGSWSMGGWAVLWGAGEITAFGVEFNFSLKKSLNFKCKLHEGVQILVMVP